MKDHIVRVCKEEPVTVTSAAIGLVGSLLALATAFGVEITADQVSAIMAAFTATIAFFQVTVVRAVVTPVAKPHDRQRNRLVPEGTSQQMVSDATEQLDVLPDGVQVLT